VGTNNIDLSIALQAAACWRDAIYVSALLYSISAFFSALDCARADKEAHQNSTIRQLRIYISCVKYSKKQLRGIGELKFAFSISV
jgi:hypothetical protein